MIRVYEFDWTEMTETQWLTNMNDGYIAVYGEASSELCKLIHMQAEKWARMPQSRPRDILINIIDCQSGAPDSWPLSLKLSELGCRTRAYTNAGSAGLFLFMSGDERTGTKESRFIFHGNLYRWMKSGPTDEERAEWFSSRTNMSYDWWLEKANLDGTFEFGYEEAIEFGVVTSF